VPPVPPAAALSSAGAQATYVDKVIPQLGLAVTLYEILKVEGGAVHPGEGAALFTVLFSLVIFRPFVGEVLKGKITSSSKAGLQARARRSRRRRRLLSPPAVLRAGLARLLRGRAHTVSVLAGALHLVRAACAARRAGAVVLTLPGAVTRPRARGSGCMRGTTCSWRMRRRYASEWRACASLLGRCRRRSSAPSPRWRGARLGPHFRPWWSWYAPRALVRRALCSAHSPRAGGCE
jgi:hypothetical protein